MDRKEVTFLMAPIGVPATCGVLHMLRGNPDGMPVRIIGIDLVPERAEKYLVDRYCALPPFDTPAFEESLVALCAEERVDFLLAQTEGAALGMARCQEMLEAICAKPLIASRECVQRAADKGAFLSSCAAAGLSTPRFAVVRKWEELRAASAALGYPESDCIVKPTDQCGSRGIYILSAHMPPASTLFRRVGPASICLDQLEESMRAGACPLLLMEYLPGDEYSVDLFVGRELEVAVPRRRCRIVGGTTIESVVEDDPFLVQQSLLAAKALGMTQLFGFQFKRDAAGVARLLECNPRIQSNAIAALFGGVNIVWMAVREALGMQGSPAIMRAPVVVQRTFGGVAFGPGWHEVF